MGEGGGGVPISAMALPLFGTQNSRQVNIQFCHSTFCIYYGSVVALGLEGQGIM